MMHLSCADGKVIYRSPLYLEVYNFNFKVVFENSTYVVLNQQSFIFANHVAADIHACVKKFLAFTLGESVIFCLITALVSFPE